MHQPGFSIILESTSYPLSMAPDMLSSPVEKDRLQRQTPLGEPEVERWLARLGIQPGWHCLEVGCSAMDKLGPLSRRVGPTGWVVGIDTDPAWAAARAFVGEEGLANEEMVKRSACPDTYAIWFTVTQGWEWKQ